MRSSLFTALLLLGGLTAVVGVGANVRPLLGMVAVVPVILLVMGIWRFSWALRHALGLTGLRAFRAMGNFFSLG